MTKLVISGLSSAIEDVDRCKQAWRKAHGDIAWQGLVTGPGGHPTAQRP